MPPTIMHVNGTLLVGCSILPDHRVELKAFGTQEAIEHLIEWLYRGPPLAHVTELEIVDIPWENHEDFEIIREIPH